MSGHKPIQPEAHRVMNALAKGIDDALNGEDRRPKKWGFALLVFPFDEPGRQDRMNYIGNGKRDDVLVAIKELAARWEGRYAETEETVQ
jgi:hypothetical protein